MLRTSSAVPLLRRRIGGTARIVVRLRPAGSAPQGEPATGPEQAIGPPPVQSAILRRCSSASRRNG